MNGNYLSNENHPTFQIRPDATAIDLRLEAENTLTQAKGMAFAISAIEEENSAPLCVSHTAWALAEMLDRLEVLITAEFKQRRIEAKAEAKPLQAA